LILLAKHAGFCFGVKRAVEAVQGHIGQRLVSLGPLIHNPFVVESLKKQGVRCADSLDEVLKDETVIIRSHGTVPQTYEELRKRGINYIDATCIFVKRIHERVKEARQDGLTSVIIGEAGHPEVEATLGWAGKDARVVYSKEDVDKLPDIEQAVIVAQTTITEDKWTEMLCLLEHKISRVIPFKSICLATQQRQSEARQIARRADTVIVVGGKKSSNTCKLAQLCAEYCKNVYHIEHKNELLPEKSQLFKCYSSVFGKKSAKETFDSCTGGIS